VFIRNQNRVIPFETHETGKLRWGITDPQSTSYDPLSDLYGSSSTNTIELRLPWNLLNFKDPSRKEGMGDVWKGGLGSSSHIEKINIGVVTYKPDENGNATGEPGEVNIADSINPPVDSKLTSINFYSYDYPKWDLPPYHERLKDSYYIIKETYSEF
jgi:hypothetical protein